MAIVKVTNDTFEQEVLACEVPVLLDFCRVKSSGVLVSS